MKNKKLIALSCSLLIIFFVLTFLKNETKDVHSYSSTSSGHSKEINENLSNINAKHADKLGIKDNQSVNYDPAVTRTFLDNSDECSVLGIKNKAVIFARQGEDLRMSVIDDRGTLLSKAIAFYPTAHSYAIERSDGTLLTLLSNLRLNSKKMRDKDTDEPVLIMLDNDVLLQTNKAFGIGAASDGSSFYVIKPSDNKNVELIIHNLKDNIVSTYDVTHLYDPDSTFDLYFAQMTPSNDAVWISPEEEGAADRKHYLFPVTGSSSTIVDADIDWNTRPVFYNLSKILLLESNIKEKTVSIEILALPTSSSGLVELSSISNGSIWKEELSGYPINNSDISIRDDELLLLNSGVRVFNLDTGNATFFLSSNEDNMRDRLKWGDSLGAITKARLTEKGIQIKRIIGLEHLAQCEQTGMNYEQCVATLKQNGYLFEVVDEFKKTVYGYEEFVSNSTLLKNDKCVTSEFSTGSVRAHADEELYYGKN